MSDARTRKTIARRKLAKIVIPITLGALLGIILRMTTGFEPIAGAIALVEPLIESLPQVKSWVTENPIGQFIATWVSAPFVLVMLTLALTTSRWGQRFLNRFFPDPPSFVLSDLGARRRDRMIGLDIEPPPFVGRIRDLGELERFRDQTKEKFAWLTMIGTSGVGKSRLAIEWLESSRGANWDVGIVDPVDRDLLRDWKPRKPTALVIEEAVSDFKDDLGAALFELSAKGDCAFPVRVVVVDQAKPDAGLRDARRQKFVEDSESEAFVLGSLPDQAIKMIADAFESRTISAEKLIEEAAGRPRAALALLSATDPTDYADALRQWTNRIVPKLAPKGNDAEPNERVDMPISVSIPLIASVLAGPIDAAHVRACSGSINAARLTRFFPIRRQEEMKIEIPRFEPDDLGQELALRLLEFMDIEERKKTVEMLLMDQDRLESRLARIWRDRPDLLDAGNGHPAARQLAYLQSRFDQKFPACGTKQQALAASFLKNLNPTRQSPEIDWQKLEDIRIRRPFDETIVNTCIEYVKLLIHDFAETGNLEVTALWTDRIAALLDRPAYRDWIKVREATLRVALCVMIHAFEHKKFDESLVRDRIEPALAGDPALSVTDDNGRPIYYLVWEKAVGMFALIGQIDEAFENFTKLSEHMEANGACNVTMIAQIRIEALMWAITGLINSTKDLDAAKNMVRIQREIFDSADLDNDIDSIGAKAVTIGCLIGPMMREKSPIADVLHEAAEFIDLVDHLLSSDPESSRYLAVGLLQIARNISVHFAASPTDGDGETWINRFIRLTDNSVSTRWAETRLEASAVIANCAGYAYSSKDKDLLNRCVEQVKTMFDKYGHSSEPSIAAFALHAMNFAFAWEIERDNREGVEHWLVECNRIIETSAGYKLQEAAEEEAVFLNNFLWFIENSKGEPPEGHDEFQKRLAHLAQHFISSTIIQQYASQYGLTYEDQRHRGYPYGKATPLSTGSHVRTFGHTVFAQPLSVTYDDSS